MPTITNTAQTQIQHKNIHKPNKKPSLSRTFSNNAVHAVSFSEYYGLSVLSKYIYIK